MKAKAWLILLFLIYLGTTLRAQDPYLRGVVLLHGGDHAAAIEQFLVLLDSGRTTPELCLRLAESYLAIGDYLRAREWAGKANELSGSIGDYILARSWAMEGQPEQSMKCLQGHMGSPYKLPRHEILLDPAFTEIEKTGPWRDFWKAEWYSEKEELEFEAGYLRRSGDYIGALKLVKGQLDSNPRWHELIGEKARILHGMEQYSDAVRSWTQAISISPATTGYYYGRAVSRSGMGRYDEAVSDLKHVIRKEPENIDLLMETSLVCMSAGNYNEAGEYIRQYLAYYPHAPQGYYTEGLIYTASGQYLKALGSYNRCLAMDRHNPVYFIARGRTYMETDTWSYAERDFSMALDLDPRNSETWYNKGICRLKLNDIEGAVSDLETAARYGSHEAAEQLRQMNRL